jgi:hypothetical protein
MMKAPEQAWDWDILKEEEEEEDSAVSVETMASRTRWQKNIWG